MSAREFFESLPAKADPSEIAGIENTYRFDIDGEGSWLVALSDGIVTVTENPEDEGDVTIKTSAAVFEKVVAGEQNPTTAVLTGKIKLSGDTSAALKLQKLF